MFVLVSSIEIDALFIFLVYSKTLFAMYCEYLAVTTEINETKIAISEVYLRKQLSSFLIKTMKQLQSFFTKPSFIHKIWEKR